MRTLQQFCVAFVLTLALAFTAFAGQIDTMRIPPPPEGRASTPDTATAPVTEIMLNLIQGVLSLI